MESVVLRCVVLLLATLCGVHGVEAEEGVSVLSSDGDGIALEVQVPLGDLQETRAADGMITRIALPGWDRTGEEGVPVVPVKGLLVEVPADAEPAVEWVQGEPVERARVRMEVVGPEPAVGGEGDGKTGKRENGKTRRQGDKERGGQGDRIQNSGVRIQNGGGLSDKEKETRRGGDRETRGQGDKGTRRGGWIPWGPVEIRGTGWIRGRKVAQVAVYPILYDVSRGVVRMYPALRIRIGFRRGVGKAAVGRSWGPDPVYDGLLERALVNGGQIEWGAGRPRAKLGTRTRNPKSEIRNPKSGGPWFKILVDRDGMVVLDYEELRAAGVPMETVDPRTVRIYNEGREVPLDVWGEADGRLDPGDRIVFCGRFYRGRDTYFSPYTRTNVYWMTWGREQGARMARVQAASVTGMGVPGTYRHTVHLEEDRIFSRLPEATAEVRDYGFWRTLGGTGLTRVEVPLSTPFRTSRASTIRITLQGLSSATAWPDHHVQVYWNSHYAGEAYWDGQSPYAFEAEVPTSILRHGDNELTLVTPWDTAAGEDDQSFLNAVEVTYWRTFQAVKDELWFTGEPGSRRSGYRIGGFSEPEIWIYDVVGRKIVGGLVAGVTGEDGGTTYEVTFRDPQARAGPFIAVTSGRMRPPRRIAEDTPSDLRSPAQGADYVVITHRDFMTAAERIAAFREAQGLRATVVDVEDVYDEFAEGIHTPVALREFLTYAYDRWVPPAPSYVLLLGDASHRYDWGSGDFVPTYLVSMPRWGLGAHDGWFALVSGDDPFPDMMVGRLPASTPEQAEAMADKIIAYEEAPQRGTWRREVLLLSAPQGYFTEGVDRLAEDFIPASYGTSRMYTAPRSSPYYGDTGDLVRALDQGAALVNFYGHGGGSIWSDSGLFGLGDVDSLQNAGRLPFILSMTCYTGYFESPGTRSLGEAFIKAEETGAAAFLGAAGKGWVYGGRHYAEQVFRALFEDGERTVGRAIALAQVRLPTVYGGYRHLIEENNLLGDPALRLALPPQTVAVTVDPVSAVGGDVLHVQGTVPDIPAGAVQVSVRDGSGNTVLEELLPLSDGAFAGSVALPEDAAPGEGSVVCYVEGDRGDAVGWTAISVDSLHIAAVRTDPPDPGPGEGVYIVADVHVSPALDPDGPDSVRCGLSVGTEPRIVPMAQRTGTTYATVEPVRLDAGGTATYWVEVLYGGIGGSPSTARRSTPSQSLRIPHPPDLRPLAGSLTLAGTRRVMLSGRVRNAGDRAARDVTVRFIQGDQPLGEAYLPLLDAHADTTVAVPWPGGVSGHPEISMTVDVYGRIAESDEGNNTATSPVVVDRFAVTPEAGTGGPVASADTGCVVSIPAGAVGDSTVLQLKRVPTVDAPDQPDLAPLEDGTTGAYAAVLGDGTVPLSGRMTMALRYNPGSTAPDDPPGLYYWVPDAEHWVRSESARDTTEGLVRGSVPLISRYALFRNRDHTPPRITFGMQDGDYVAAGGTLSASLEDRNGVDTVERPVRVSLDEVPVPPEEIAVSPGRGAGMVLVTCRTEGLRPGSHVLTVEAYDTNGNRAEASLRVSITSAFGIQTLANHPNPFWEDTVIALTLTDYADDLTIGLYTLSGRLVRRFRTHGVVGYYEQLWDGIDEEGHPVANGTYYLKATAEQGGRRAERLSKVSVLR